MSESMAFVGGVAVAGLAALLLLKGNSTPIQQPNFGISQLPNNIVPSQGMQQYPSGQGGYGNPQPVAPLDQRLDLEKLKIQVDSLRGDNEQLRLQNQQLQGQINAFSLSQNQMNSLQQQPTRMMPTLPSEAEKWWNSPIIWAVGGATLTVGGGIVVAGVLSLFSPRQRPSRTVQVIHPYHGVTAPLGTMRRAEFLPPSHAESRRVETAEYDELH
ncbi:heterocyst differentiation related protein [Cylindrospermopsis raciborskii]|uniref:heterocyst differentiation related protein n=1 Tax=Cylindrospermopsis raciborskii TaxID=77022 RepID=UPI0038D08F2E